MSAYLGILGRLVPIYSNPSMTVTGLPPRTFEKTLGGRVKVQVGKVGRRTWELGAQGASPTDVGALQSFAAGEWGNGPFVWVSPTAPVTNMLTPEQSLCDQSTLYTAGVIAGGPLNLGADGWAGRSFLNPTPATTFRFGGQGASVLPGQNVTASAYVVGAGAKVQIRWEDAAGTYISTSDSAAVGVAGSAVRASVTAIPPTNAAIAYVNALSASQAARPALTWTDQAFEWGVGEGCPKAIVDEVSRTAVGASDRIEGWRDSEITFRIKEVG